MGFKAFKNHYGIEKHTVSVSDGVIYIGSDYVSKLVGFDMQTGAVLVNETFPGFLKELYPHILEATDEERLSLIKTKDVFEHSIPVYTTKTARSLKRHVNSWAFRTSPMMGS